MQRVTYPLTPWLSIATERGEAMRGASSLELAVLSVQFRIDLKASGFFPSCSYNRGSISRNGYWLEAGLDVGRYVAEACCAPQAPSAARRSVARNRMIRALDIIAADARSKGPIKTTADWAMRIEARHLRGGQRAGLVLGPSGAEAATAPAAHRLGHQAPVLPDNNTSAVPTTCTAKKRGSSRSRPIKLKDTTPAKQSSCERSPYTHARHFTRH